MKKAIPILVLLLGLGVYVYFYHIRPSREYDPVVRGSGTIELTEVVVSSKIAARITAVLGNEGDQVKRGDVLAVMSCEDLELRLAQAQLQVSQAESAIIQARAGKKQARAASVQARTSLKPMEVSKEHAALELKRAEQLVQTQGVPQKALDDAQSAVRRIDEQLAAAADGVTVADKAVEVAGSAVAVAQVGAEIARRNVSLAAVALSECKLTAPISGVIMRRNFEAGEMVLPGSAIYRIADLKDAYTWIYVANEEVGKVRLGTEVKLLADTYPGRVFKGQVVRINDEAEFTPKSVQTKDDRTRLVYGVKVTIPNRDGALLAGMPVEAELTDTILEEKNSTVRDASPSLGE
jgi:HlyD family secretion protein